MPKDVQKLVTMFGDVVANIGADTFEKYKINKRFVGYATKALN